MVRARSIGSTCQGFFLQTIRLPSVLVPGSRGRRPISVGSGGASRRRALRGAFPLADGGHARRGSAGGRLRAVRRLCLLQHKTHSLLNADEISMEGDEAGQTDGSFLKADLLNADGNA